MQNRQIDNKTTKQIRIDTGWHRILKTYAARSGRTIREVVEDILSDVKELREQIDKGI